MLFAKGEDQEIKNYNGIHFPFFFLDGIGVEEAGENRNYISIRMNCQITKFRISTL